jgi:DNA-binding NarL/FixJ family response regulator
MVRSLIVDDSSIVRERLGKKLSTFGRVEVVGNVGDIETALIAFDREKPNMVILDIQLPDGNGIEALTKIKQQNEDTVVVMLTNYPFEAFRKRCLDAGADYFFDKSTEFDKIMEVVRLMEAESGSVASNPC